MTDDLFNKVLGSIIGATIGDAVGIVVEGRNRETARRILDGKDWVENMYGIKEMRANPLGIFRENPPRGTGTDDTRLNQIFVECVIKNKGFINSQLLAMEYIERYRNAEQYYPETFDNLAKRHMGYFYPLCCSHLGMKDIGDFKAETSFEQGIYLNELNSFPILSGLLSLQSTGLLYQDNPEKAYQKAVEMDFFDLGFAKDATGLLAAIVSTALNNRHLNAGEIIDIGIKTNPYQLGGPSGDMRIMTGVDPCFLNAPSLPKLFKAVNGIMNDQEAVLALAKECEFLHPFSPLDILGVPMTIIRHTKGDPIRSIIMAANHRIIDENNTLLYFRDSDCVAMITGVIVGAINGLDAFPKDWIRDVISANIDVYGFNIEQNAKKFYDVIYRKH